MPRRLWGLGLVALLCATPGWAGVLKGPYLQNSNNQGITVALETDAPGDAVLEYGLDDSYGTTQTAPAWADKVFPDGTRYIYKFRLEGLPRGTAFHYRVTHGETVSPDRVFTTAPMNTTPFTFVALGDSRNGSIDEPNTAHEAVAAAVLEHDPLFYVNTGDFVRSGGEFADWDYHFYVENELMGHASFVPVFGNHEDGCNLGTGICGDDLWQWYFDTTDDDIERTWYSFDFANVHYVVLDEEKWWLLFPGATQIEWLKEDLAQYQANPHTNFLIVSFHQPAFSFKAGRMPEFPAVALIEPVIRPFKPDIVICGHDHFYARKTMHGITHMVTGGAGAPLYDMYEDIEDWPGYQAAAKDHHYVLVHVTPESMSFEAYNTPSDELLDSFTIMASQPPEPEDDDADDDADDDTDDDATDDDTGDDDAGDDDTGPSGADDDAASGSGGSDDDNGKCGC